MMVPQQHNDGCWPPTRLRPSQITAAVKAIACTCPEAEFRTHVDYGFTVPARIGGKVMHAHRVLRGVTHTTERSATLAEALRFLGHD